MAKSLRALRTDWLDILFVHEPQPGRSCRVGMHLLSGSRARRPVAGPGIWGWQAALQIAWAVMQQVPGIFDVLQVEDSLGAMRQTFLLQRGSRCRSPSAIFAGPGATGHRMHRQGMAGCDARGAGPQSQRHGARVHAQSRSASGACCVARTREFVRLGT